MPTETVTIELPNRAGLDAERAVVLAECAALPPEIASPQEFKAIEQYEARVSDFLARAEPLFDDHVSAALKVHRQACALRKAFVEPAQALKARCRAMLGAYKERELRLRREEEQRIADTQRAEQLAAQKREAKALRDEGQPEAAAAVLAAPIDVAPVVLPSIVPDVEGLTFREDWYWEPVGGDTPLHRARALTLLCPKWAQFVKLDDAALTAIAKRLKGAYRVPGIVFRSKQVPVRR